MKTATIGPTRPPRPPARLTPPRTMAATLEQRVGPGTGAPMPVLAGQGEAAERREEARSAHRRRSSSGRPRRRSGRRRAGGCRWRTARARARPAERDPDDADHDDEDDERPGAATRLPTEPLTSSFSHCAAPPPGRVEDQQGGAGPDERHRQRHDDVRHAGDDDERAVDRAEDEAQERGRRRRRRTANTSLWPCIRTAAVTLVSAIIGPTERSMPPEITTIVWATAAKASGRRAIARPWTLGAPYDGWISFVRTRKHDEEPEEAERPAVPPAHASQRDAMPAERRRRAAASCRRSGAVDAGGLGAVAGRATPAGRRFLGDRRGDLFGHRHVGRQVVGGAQEGRLVGVLDGDLGDDPAAEDDDRAVAGELDLLELGGVEQDRRARRRRARAAAGRSGAWCRCRCRGSGRSRAASARRRRPSGRSSPSAGCRRTAAGPRLRRGCRSAAGRWRRPTRRRSSGASIGPQRPQRGGERQRDVLADRALHQQRLGAVGRHVDEAGADRVGRDGGRRPAVPSTSSSPPLGPVRAGEDVEQLVLALALERDDAEDLAGAELERDVGELASRRAGCGPSSRGVAVGSRSARSRAADRAATVISLTLSRRASARRSGPRTPR